MQQALSAHSSVPLAPIRGRLQAFDFVGLFNELGWDYFETELPVSIKESSYLCRGIAQKRGFQVFLCHIATGNPFPDRATRVQIDRAVTRLAREHLLIFVDAAESMQIWHWTERQPGQPLRLHEQEFRRGQSGEGLAQRLRGLFIKIEEDDESLTVLDISGRVHRSLAAERVTRRFYERFKQEHDAFRKFVAGIKDVANADWYASLMLNRLMFIYFIQKKGFLAGDDDYLRHKLAEVRADQGEGQFLSFYRHFLRRLFHEGLSLQAQERPRGLDSLIGNVPYLNGGLFDVHDLEAKYPAIDIPDQAFDTLFDFFDAFRWYLDERPLRQDDEINPDVLGYIFEKYINQKQMGAYYTKEDITEYIGKNTIVPAILDRAKEGCAVAFRPDGALWKLLSDDPDRYIYPAVRKGTDLPLPPEIAAGLNDVTKRGEWNRPAADGFALPTETWREHIARRKRYEETWETLVAGDVTTADQLITLNLDLRQFAQDAIAGCEGPETLRAFWKAIESLSVLDPTCGSGAFLFAALNILQPLADECLDRMQAFVDELERSDQAHRPERFGDFRKILAKVEAYPNREYFVLKQIVLNNLYGVDIMAEAVEICKLRLFLKLVAQLEDVRQIEPLPDIDFNIRTGNTLVGFVSLDEVDRALSRGKAGQLKMVDAATSSELDRMKEEAEKAAMASARFRDLQDEDTNSAEQRAAKQEVRNRLETLRAELDGLQARVYGIEPKGETYDAWLKTHQPFHWLSEFYEIINNRDGFDVIIGNPPYIVYSRQKVEYELLAHQYKTISTKNLYAIVFERSLMISGPTAPVGFIVQLTVMSSERLSPLQDLLRDRGTVLGVSFPRRPQSIFDGVEMPVTILLSIPLSSSSFTSSSVDRFYSEERSHALSLAQLVSHDIRIDDGRIAKIGSRLELGILERMLSSSVTLDGLIGPGARQPLYYQEACRYWVKSFYGVPYFRRNGEDIEPPHGRFVQFQTDEASAFAFSLVNSSLFYWFYSVFSDCEHVNDGLVRLMPIPQSWNQTTWSSSAHRLAINLSRHARRKEIQTKQGHKIEFDEMKAQRSKFIIDEIDRVLAKHYGFTDEELDFIINYDIKYRMGRDNADDAA